MNSFGGCIPDLFALAGGITAGLFCLFLGIWLANKTPPDKIELSMMQATANALTKLGEITKKQKDEAEIKGPETVLAFRAACKRDAESFKASLPKRYKK